MTDYDTFHALVLVFAAAPVIVAAATDIREFKIPNECSILLLIMYPMHVWLSPVDVDVFGGIIVSASVFALTFTLFFINRLGGGDVKLLTALGLWAGPALIADLLVITTISGAVLAILFISRAGVVIALGFDQIGQESARDNVLAERLPYGVAIACGGLATIWALIDGVT